MSKMFVFVVSFVKAGCLFDRSQVFGLFAPPQTAVSCSLICLVLCSVYFIVQLVLKSKSRSFTHSFWLKRAHIQVEAKNTTQKAIRETRCDNPVRSDQSEMGFKNVWCVWPRVTGEAAGDAYSFATGPHCFSASFKDKTGGKQEKAPW